MADYSRHTTNKGHLLLNIKPPSTTQSPQGKQVQQYTQVQQSTTVPYMGIQNINNQPRPYSHATNPHSINTQNAYYGPNPSLPQNPQLYTPPAQLQSQQAYLNSRLINNEVNYQPRPYINTSPQTNIGKSTYTEKPFNDNKYWEDRKK